MHGASITPEQPEDRRERSPAARVPLALKLILAAFTIVLVVAYARHYGLVNFLWFSNVALVLLTVGVLLESPLLISMVAVGVLLPEMAWAGDFLARLLLGRPALGFTEYFWTGHRPPWVRALTLYHLILPPLLWWLVGRLGYDRRGFAAWCALAGGVVLVVLLGADPARNLNQLWGIGGAPQTAVPRWLYLIGWTIAAALIWWSTHRLLLWARPRVSP